MREQTRVLLAEAAHIEALRWSPKGDVQTLGSSWVTNK